MTSRNTFITNYIYDPVVLHIVEESLIELGVKEFTVCKNMVYGVLPTLGNEMPLEEYNKLLSILDNKIAKVDVGYKRVEIVVVGDDSDDVVCRVAPIGCMFLGDFE